MIDVSPDVLSRPKIGLEFSNENYSQNSSVDP